MKAQEMQEKLKMASQAKNKISEMLEEDSVDLDVAIAVLMAVATDAALNQADMTPHALISKFANSVCAFVEMMEESSEEGDDDEEGEKIKWLN